MGREGMMDTIVLYDGGVMDESSAVVVIITSNIVGQGRDRSRGRVDNKLRLWMRMWRYE